AVAPAEQSGAHSVRVAEAAERPVAKSDCSMRLAVPRESRTKSGAVFEPRSRLVRTASPLRKGTAHPIPNRIALGKVVEMHNRKVVRFHTCRKTMESEHTDRTSLPPLY